MPVAKVCDNVKRKAHCRVKAVPFSELFNLKVIYIAKYYVRADSTATPTFPVPDP